MRVIRTRIHQAFPSLDSYEPAAAARIVAVSRRPILWKLLSLLACVAVLFIVAFPFPLVLAGIVYNNLEDGEIPQDWMWVAVGGALSVCICLSAFAAFITRDLILARRIRTVLAQPDRCIGCGYELAGLALNESGDLRCPECHLQARPMIAPTKVAEGPLDLKPTVQPEAAAAPRLSPKTERTRRVLFWGAIAAVCLAGIGVFLYGRIAEEVTIYAESSKAKRARTGLPMLAGVAEAVQPVPSSATEPEGWDLLSAAHAARARSDKKAGSDGWPNGMGKSEAAAAEHYAAVYAMPGDGLLATKALWNTDQINRYRNDAVWDAYDKLAQFKRGTAPIARHPVPVGLGLDASQQFELGVSALLLVQRMNAAIETGNIPDLVRAYETCLALGRLLQMQPTFRLFQSGCRVELLAHETLVSHMVRSPTKLQESALRELLAALKRQIWVAPPSHPWDGENIALLDQLADTYSSSRFLSERTESPEFEWFVSKASGPLWPTPKPEGDIGTFESVTQEFTGRALARLKYASLPIRERAIVQDMGEAKHLIINCLERVCRSYPGLDGSLASARAGVSTLIAIEIYKRRHRQALPASVEEAVRRLDALTPIDPYTGNALILKPCDPASDPLGRSYLLYSVGEDQRDDGGKAHSASFLETMLPRGHRVPAISADFDQVYNTAELTDPRAKTKRP